MAAVDLARPLGGSWGPAWRRHVNLLITMLLGGLWHGAGWTFVAWGGLNGLALIVNHLLRASFPVSRAPVLIKFAVVQAFGYLNAGGPLPQVAEIVRRACGAIRRAGLRLGVIYIPESRWLNQRYTAAQRADFIRAASLFGACADWVDLSAFASTGYDNRYFVNRYLVDNYPYAGWQDLSAAQRWINEDAVERRWQFFDPDHMSAAGARVFSAAQTPRLSQWITAERGGKQ